MLKKVCCFLLLIAIMSTFTFTIKSYADSSDVLPSDVKERLKNVSNPDGSSDDFNSSLALVLRLIQYAGTGIALVVVTIYGIKYMLASPAEKADVKKQVVPILIGCGLLFGAVTIVGIIANMSLVLKT